MIIDSYSHGSAQNIDVITGFMCDALVNTCGADQTAKTTCAAAKAAADTAPAKTGAQADSKNSLKQLKSQSLANVYTQNLIRPSASTQIL